MLMETLFRATALESRLPLNMNVLDGGRTPRVMSLKEVLRAWLDHRHEVLVRRSRHRLAAIERRLEILAGYLVVFLDLDAVIRIIREEDSPAPHLMARFSLTKVQAEAILNMRLRSLRRLEEMEIREEHTKLTREKRELATLLRDQSRRWTHLASEIEEVRARFATSARRTLICSAPAEIAVATEALVEREAVTVILSEKGWIRAVKGSVTDPAELRFKEGDRLKLLVACETTDRLSLFATNGRAYTLKAADIPRGRGDGEPVRLLVELGNADDVITLFLAARARASSSPAAPAAASSSAPKTCWPKNAPAARCSTSARTTKPPSPSRSKATTSPPSAPTAACSSSRSTKCPSSRAAAASSCNATATANSPPSKSSPSPKALAGATAAAAARIPTSRPGPAPAAKPATPPAGTRNKTRGTLSPWTPCQELGSWTPFFGGG